MSMVLVDTTSRDTIPLNIRKIKHSVNPSPSGIKFSSCVSDAKEMR
jgi:hypothetical protein